MSILPRLQRVAAYAVVLRLLEEVGEYEILLSRLSSRVTATELWTLPGGGVEHGEDPAAAVVREVQEETGLEVSVGEVVQVQSAHWPDTWRAGRRVDAQALRVVYEAWVGKDAPEPHTVEVDGTTMDAAWHRVSTVLDGSVPVSDTVVQAVTNYAPTKNQRLAAYGLIRRGDAVLLARISERGFHTGSWTLPGGGVDHGEAPADALVREVREECGVEAQVGDLLGVHDLHFTGTAPNGRLEDFHGVHLVFAATVPETAEARITEVDGTTDEVAWVRESSIASGEVPVLELVGFALEQDARRTSTTRG